jgi:SAM-dependent methyltransferase
MKSLLYTHLHSPISLICPACRNTTLTVQGEDITCVDCGRHFGFSGQFPDLIIGERFEDSSDEELLLYEEQSNAYLTENYFLPLFRRLWPEQDFIKLLSCGCGTGVDVDLLNKNGFECIGIDCGNRTNVWHRRQHRECLFLANGKHLPFEDKSFDGAFCGCVLPHVGVVGDTNQVRDNYYDERLALAREMSRVVKPGGKMVLASPNRLFPLDIFHDRKAGSYKPRINWPTSRFLLSLKDYRNLFIESGCVKAETLPVNNYWGFVRSKKSWKGFIIGLPVAFIFWLVSQESLKFLRNSPINPWLVVLITR